MGSRIEEQIGAEAEEPVPTAAHDLVDELLIPIEAVQEEAGQERSTVMRLIPWLVGLCMIGLLALIAILVFQFVTG